MTYALLAAALPLALSDAIVDQPGGMSPDNPVVASDGDGYLVVWSDPRGTTETMVYGARVAGDGTVLDPGGFLLWDEPGDHGLHDVAWGDGVYLVVWLFEDQVRAARVDPEGHVLDDPPLIVAQQDLYYYSDPTVAARGSEFQVIWTQGPNGGPFPMYGNKVTADGQVGTAFPLYTGPDFDALELVMAAGRDDYVIGWDGSPTNGGTKNKIVVDGTIAWDVLAPQGYARLASAGDTHFLSWTQLDGGDYNSYGIYLTGSPAVASGPAIPMVSGDPDETQVLFDGVEFQVTWIDYDDPDLQVMQRAFAPDGTSGVAHVLFKVPFLARDLATAAASPTNELVAYIDKDGLHAAVLTAPFFPDAGVPDAADGADAGGPDGSISGEAGDAGGCSCRSADAGAGAAGDGSRGSPIAAALLTLAFALLPLAAARLRR